MTRSGTPEPPSSLDYARKRMVQGLRGLMPWMAAKDVDWSILDVLTPMQRERFETLPMFDQQHLCRVGCHLRDHGITDRDVLVAGLLHDIGKSDGQARVRFPDRVAKVILKRFAPGRLRAIAGRYPDGRLRGLALTVRHPEVGAGIARTIGCSERTCWLIAHHEDPTDHGDPGLVALQAADFAS